MVLIRRVLKLGALALLATAVTGCIVLPYGPGHGGRHSRGGGHHAQPSNAQPIMHQAPQERPYSRSR
ncbi:MAG: hypothetical protein Q8K45_18025 [Rubrivivax sp.]|nr:hypothetical protein [Rubrivivax sp.]